MADLRQIAEDYVSIGMTVIPVHNKKILKTGWQQSVLNSVFEPSWDSFWAQANGIGLVLGDASQGIVCLDVDILEDCGDQDLLDLRKQIQAMLPPIYCGVFGNPKKMPAVFFKMPTTYEFKSTKSESLSIDILGPGRQKVIPPSYNHDSKTYYEWVGTPLLTADLDVMPEFPEELYHFLQEKIQHAKFDTQEIKLTAEKGRCNHNSHTYFGRFGMRLFYQGYTLEDIADLAIEEDKKINANADKLYFECSTRAWKSNEVRLNALQWAAEFFYRNLLKRNIESDFFKDEIENGFTLQGAKPGQYTREYIKLANYFKCLYQPVYLAGQHSFMIWDGKQYKQESESFVKAFAQKYFKNPTCTKINEKMTFLDYVKHDKIGDIKDFSLDGSMQVNFQNGVYDLNRKQLVPHDKKFKFNYIFNVPLIQKFETPIWDLLLKNVTLDRPHLQIAIEQFFGYVLSGCKYNRFNKILIFDGAGSNGKSTVIEILQMILGDGNYSGESLVKITQERFAAYSLFNKFVNICGEEPRDAFENTGPIKKLTGNDAMNIEQKGRDAFKYTNIAKLIITYNKMPFLPDDSIGMRRRMMIIPFDQNFDENPELKIINVHQQIKPELGAIAYRCLKAFEDVLSKEAFIDLPESNDKVDQILIESNPIRQFVKESLIITQSAKDFIATDLLYERFLEFTGERTKFTRIGFGRKFSDLAYELGIHKDDADHKNRGYRRIRFI